MTTLNQNKLSTIEIDYKSENVGETSIKIDGNDIARGVMGLAYKMEPGKFPIISIDLMIDKCTISADGEIMFNGIINSEETAREIYNVLKEQFNDS